MRFIAEHAYEPGRILKEELEEDKDETSGQKEPGYLSLRPSLAAA